MLVWFVLFYRVPRVGMSADGSTLVGWHPEPEHPYEHTQVHLSACKKHS